MQPGEIIELTRACKATHSSLVFLLPPLK